MANERRKGGNALKKPIGIILAGLLSIQILAVGQSHVAG